MSGAQVLRSRVRQQLRTAYRNLESYVCQPSLYPDDVYGVRLCNLACRSVESGNFGVSALLARWDGRVLFAGHNQIFEPFFRSDLHAEMVILNRLERRMQGDSIGPRRLTLISSVEPCPMCVSRMIIAGVQQIRFIADDPRGGFAHRLGALPPAWKDLLAGREIVRAKVSPYIREIATLIFGLTVHSLDRKLRGRFVCR